MNLVISLVDSNDIVNIKTIFVPSVSIHKFLLNSFF